MPCAFFLLLHNAITPSDPTSPPQCAHAANAVSHFLHLQSAVINSCDNINNEIQVQALGMKLTPDKNPDIEESLCFEGTAVEFERGEGTRCKEVVMMWKEGKRTKWGKMKEKGQTIQHKLSTHDQYFGIYQKLQNYLDVCMGLTMHSKF
jgi:hypothetical protein